MVDSFKYLGIVMDSDLNWRHHIDTLSTKLSQAAGAILKLRHLVSNKTLVTVYNSLAGSHLDYGVLIYGTAKSCFMQKLQAAQNKLIRLMTFAHPMQNIEQKYLDMSVLKIDMLYKWELAKFMYKISNSLIPPVFNNFLPKINHPYNTRNKE